jgi:ribose transport system ATP-binding protein
MPEAIDGGPQEAPVLEARNISKSFTGVRALRDVSLRLQAGRLTALLGENGAGKSTLMNIIAGVLQPDEGTLFLQGTAKTFANPRAAQEAGIAMIFQELNLLPNLSIAENIFIGREPTNALGLLDYPRLNSRAAALLAELDLPLAPTTIVGDLRVGQQQVVEIARALSRNPLVMIMDEPTSALTDHEVEVLFALIGRLKQRGVAIAYITHKFEELPRIGDEAVIMRDGQLVHAAPLKDLTRNQIVAHMVGRPATDFYSKPAPRPRSSIEPALEVRNLSLHHPHLPGKFLVENLSLVAHPGEVLGIFGLMGAGRTELLETLFGLHPPPGSSGEVLVRGRPAHFRSPRDAIAAGLALVPEDRKREGLVLSMSVAGNASLASLDAAMRGPFLDPRRERDHVARFLEHFRVKTPSLRQLIRNLSGGNQQKVILAKWLAARPRIILLDEPTRGIDVNAKRDIYQLIDQLAAEGLAIIAVSSEMPEVLAISDRIAVMSLGRKTAEFSRAEANERDLLSAALPVATEKQIAAPPAPSTPFPPEP